jgi:hypothetical protein
VQPHPLELLKVDSCDWIKQQYIMKELPYPPILSAANNINPYESMEVFQDESLYMVPIQRQALIYN